MTEPPPPKRSLFRSAGLISAATMLSRILGLIRQTLFAALLGASSLADAFVVAFRIPNLLRDLFAEGALAQAFIPTFKAELKNNSQSSAYHLGNRVAGTLLVVVGAIVATGILLAPYIVDLLAANFRAGDGDTFAVTVLLTRIMMPFLLLVSLSAVAMGMLNAQNRFTAPALAPAMFNVASIAVGAGLYFGQVTDKWAVIGWSIGTVLGGLLQLGVQLPPLWRLGYRPRLSVDLTLKNPRMRHIGKLMVPAIAGLAAVQINIIVNTIFATSEEGAAAWLNYAFRFLQLPIGVFGVAIATVSTTRYADAAADQSPSAMGKHLLEGLRLVAFLSVPSTIGLVVLSEPIIALIYEHGKFDATATTQTAAALQLYAIGLVAYSAVKVLAPAFYAMNKARVAVIASISAVIGNLAINVGFHGSFGFRALAFGTAAAAILNFSVLYWCFHRQITAIPHRRLFQHFAKVCLAGASMGAAVWGCMHTLESYISTSSLSARLLVAFVPIFVGVLVYAILCGILRVDEVSLYWQKFRTRLGKSSG